MSVQQQKNLWIAQNLTLLPTAYLIPLCGGGFHLPPTGKHTRRGLRPIQTRSFENAAFEKQIFLDSMKFEKNMVSGENLHHSLHQTTTLPYS